MTLPVMWWWCVGENEKLHRATVENVKTKRAKQSLNLNSQATAVGSKLSGRRIDNEVGYLIAWIPE